MTAVELDVSSIQLIWWRDQRWAGGSNLLLTARAFWGGPTVQINKVPLLVIRFRITHPVLCNDTAYRRPKRKHKHKDRLDRHELQTTVPSSAG